MKRIKYSIEYCDQAYLKSIGSTTICSSEVETEKFLKHLYVSIQYNKKFADMNNINKEVSVFNTKDGLIVKDNHYI